MTIEEVRQQVLDSIQLALSLRDHTGVASLAGAYATLLHAEPRPDGRPFGLDSSAASTETNLEKHAESELRKAGLFDSDSDYDGAIGPAVMKLIRAIAGDGHSGFSHHLVLDIFGKVARFKTLTPITSSTDEWMQVSPDMMPNGDPPVWQNLRQSSCFSNDGGKTYYDIDAGDGRALKESAEPIGKSDATPPGDTPAATPG